MKKITFLAFLLISSLGFSQLQTSFESSEGYNSGVTLNGQNGWAVDAGFENNIIVSSSQSTEGSQSVQIVPTNTQPGTVGALSPTITIAAGVQILTVDVFVESAPPGSLDGASDITLFTQSATAATSQVNFNFQDDIRIVDDMGSGIVFVSGGTFTRDTFFNFRIEHDLPNSEIRYYLDNTLIYTGNFFDATTVENAAFLFDDYDSGAFFDNLGVGDSSVLAVEDIDAVSFNHYFDSNGFLNLASDKQLENLTIYNILGKTVRTEQLSSTDARFNLNDLSDGVYISKVTINGQSQSFKFVKR